MLIPISSYFFGGRIKHDFFAPISSMGWIDLVLVMHDLVFLQICLFL